MSKRRIGILGGISHESTIVYYQQLVTGYYARYHDAYYPEIIIYSLDFQRFSDLEDRGETAAYIDYIAEGLEHLAAAGAEVALMAANSPHAVYEQVAARTTLPLLSIAEVTAKAAAEAGAKRLLLLGIKFTMQAGFYAKICARYGIEIVTPVEADQDDLNQLIFAELTLGSFGNEQRARLLAIIERAGQRQQFDGVILGCTELPMLLKQEHTSVKLYDTLALHVQAMLEWALQDTQNVKAAEPG
jgi:aspartate racemase